MVINGNPILNNQQHPPKTTKTINAFGINHQVPNRAQCVRMEGCAYYWFSYMPSWIREGDRYHLEKIGLEGVQWGGVSIVTCNHENWKLDKHYYFCPDCLENIIATPKPEGPPNRVFKDIPFVGLVETEASKKRTLDWGKRNDHSSI